MFQTLQEKLTQGANKVKKQHFFSAKPGIVFSLQPFTLRMNKYLVLFASFRLGYKSK